MKLQRFASCAALCLAPLLLTACSGAQVTAPVSAAPIPEAATQVHQLKNGLRVEVLPIQHDDLAELLNAKIWKFHVSSDNKTNRMLVSSVKVLQQGKVVQSIGGLGIDPFNRGATDVSVAMLPLDGSWSDAKTVKINVRMNGNGGSNTFANPFMPSATLLTDSSFQSDGTILLMAGSGKKQPNVSTSSTINSVSLVLTFTTRPITHKSQ